MTKKEKRRMLFEFGTLGFLIVGLIITTFSDWRTIAYNKKETKNLEQKYTELLEKEEALESEVNKLQDYEYLQRYAREKYYYSKEGELILILPDKNNE